MYSIIKNTLAVIGCSCALFQVLPAMAVNNSGQIAPSQGKSKVYTSYIDEKDCQKRTSDNSHIVGILATNTYSTNMELDCPAGYIMVQWHYKNKGEIINYAGGYVRGDSDVRCCAVKYKWDVPAVKA